MSSITIPAGGDWLSDPVALDVAPFDDLAISFRVKGDAANQTSHPGSRATSYLLAGDQITAESPLGAAKIDH
jgi:hypothetical protein